jgi:hypothetical protein
MEVHPLSAAGRGFTAMVIALGITGLGIWWALTTAAIVSFDRDFDGVAGLTRVEPGMAG